MLDLALLTSICLKFAIWALIWSMGMPRACVNFFKFSISIGSIFDKLNVFQILKSVGENFGR